MLSGEQLKFLRYYNGKTQQQVADWCNVSRRYIIMVEQNEERLSEETYNAWEKEQIKIYPDLYQKVMDFYKNHK